MKKMKKVLALTACAAMLVVGSVAGTLAYLTAEEQITNTFTVGKVTFGDASGDRMLVEYKVNEDGKPVNANNEIIADDEGAYVWVDTNEYKLVSGRTYTKNPTLNVGAGSEPCYLYVAVDNGIADIEDDGYTNIVSQMGRHGWKALEGRTIKIADTDTNKVQVYTYCGTSGNTGITVNHLESTKMTPYTIFDEFKIDGDATAEDLKECEDAKIRIAAYAVQKSDEGMDTAAKAWDLTFGK